MTFPQIRLPVWAWHEFYIYFAYFLVTTFNRCQATVTCFQEPVPTAMGLLAPLTEPLRELLSNRSIAVVTAGGAFAFLVVAVLLNVLSQLLFKNPNEPPLVFHWVPFIGSTVTYGIDPYRFFFSCREKVNDPFVGN